MQGGRSRLQVPRRRRLGRALPSLRASTPDGGRWPDGVESAAAGGAVAGDRQRRYGAGWHRWSTPQGGSRARTAVRVLQTRIAGPERDRTRSGPRARGAGGPGRPGDSADRDSDPRAARRWILLGDAEQASGCAARGGRAPSSLRWQRRSPVPRRTP